MNDERFSAYEAEWEAARRLEEEVLPANKRVIFDALVAAGIQLVVADFDGYGDEGHLEEAVGFDAENKEVPLPSTPITVQRVELHSSTIVQTSSTVAEFIRSLASDLLEKTHGGWEDGEGAHGTFSFDLEDRSIALDYYQRFIETDYHAHEF
jgi:hypothetical protein